MQALTLFAAFNLVCAVQAVGEDGQTAGPEHVIVFRVDPLMGRWCLGDCPVAQPIVALSPAEIVFDRHVLGHHGLGRMIRVERLTGRFTEVTINLDGVEFGPINVGQCERSAFGGFPPASLPRHGQPFRVAVPTQAGEVRPGATPR